jgi:signal transduction histidine kinase
MSIERRFVKSLLVLALVMLGLVSGQASSVTLPPLDLTNAEFAYAPGSAKPQTGWQPLHLPAVTRLPVSLGRAAFPPTAWVRIRFQRPAVLGNGIALFGDFMKENFTIFLNGTPIYRSAIDTDSASFGWYRPMYVVLPPRLLRAGRNEIVFRGTVAWPLPLGVGTIRVGPTADVRGLYQSRYFFKIIGPQIINGILAVLTFCFLLLWIGRPKDVIFGWVALVGFAWWVRNLHYFIASVPFDPDIFWALSMDSIFVVLAAAYGFAATFFDPPYRRKLILFAVGINGLAAVSRYVLITFHFSDLPAFLATVPAAIGIIYMLGRASIRTPSIENAIMFAAMMVATAFGFHDLGLIKFYWAGVSFFLMPYGSILVFSAFTFALGRRVLTAFSAVEDVNQQLENRVNEVTASLSRSESARAALQISHAVDGERERLMREIHDGIGSSLITALAVAKGRQESPETIATLTRSITDLRIGVDSLEPVNGDVVLLLASLRHRMERELKGAGLAFVWKVKAAPLLVWLDPVGALHVLRILQEAIGNVLAHADARFVEVTCGAAKHDGVEGVLIGIADDGKGFAVVAQTRGKGLANMAGRAEAIQGKFWIETEKGGGTKLSIWLPLHIAGG